MNEANYVCIMRTRLLAIGNSYVLPLPKSLIKQFDLHKSDIKLITTKKGILITPVTTVLPFDKWDALFRKAKKKGFIAKENQKEFLDWETTLGDGIE